MAEIDVLKAQIVRQDLRTPWGFVLQGGLDQGTPLKIHSLAPGSPAARIGLKSGDEVTEVGDLPTEGLTYQQVHELIDRHGDTLILTVERRARGSIPVAPVINATESDQTKDYQPYDMSGAQQQQPAPTIIPVVFEEQTPEISEMSAQPADPTTAAIPVETPAVVSVPAAEAAVDTMEQAPAALKEVTPIQIETAPIQEETVPVTPEVVHAPADPVAQTPQEVAQPPAQVAQEPVPAPTVVAQAPVQVEQPVQAAHAPVHVAQPVQVAQAPVQSSHPTPHDAAPAYQQHAPVVAMQPQAPIGHHQPQGRRQRVRARPQPHQQTAPISQIVTGHKQPQYAPVMFNPSQPYGTPIAAPPVEDNSVAILRSQEQEPISNIGPVVLAGSSHMVPEHKEAPRDYQTYDLNGPRYYQPQQAVQTHNFQFETARARPFVEQQQQQQQHQQRPYYEPQAPQQPQPQSPPPPLVAPQQPQPQYAPPPQQQQYSPRGYDYQDHQTPARVAPEDEGFHPVQSRTFKVLESLMSSEEPAAGVQGLPRQRSLSNEQWKAEQNAKRGSPRVKVFMPQQYNSPLGMYSAKNVVETFQAQAETVMDSIERYPEEHVQMSDVQRALMES